MSNPQPIKRLVIKSFLTAAIKHMEHVIQESSKYYLSNDIDLAAHCENLSLIGAKEAQISFALENFDRISTEDLERFL